MRTLERLCILLSPLLMAGCLAEPPPDVAAHPGPASSRDPGGIQTAWGAVEGRFAFASDALQHESRQSGSLFVPRNATSLRLVVDWSSAQGGFDLDVALIAPAYGPNDPRVSLMRQLGQEVEGVFTDYEGTRFAPDRPAVIEIPGPRLATFNACAGSACRWDLQVFVEGWGQDIEWAANLSAPLAPALPASQASPAALGFEIPNEPRNGTMGGVSLLAAAAIALASRTRWIRLAGAWLLFARMSKDELLDHPYRRSLADLLQREPGLSAHELHARVGGTYTNAVYHLAVMESRGLLTSVREGRHRRFFPANQVDRSEKAGVALARNPSARRVLAAVSQQGARGLGEIALGAGVVRSTASWQLRRLAAAGLVERLSADGRVLFRTTPLGAARLHGER